MTARATIPRATMPAAGWLWIGAALLLLLLLPALWIAEAEACTEEEEVADAKLLLTLLEAEATLEEAIVAEALAEETDAEAETEALMGAALAAEEA
ncbi:hypothetical protein BX666DRAFT_49671 [Dichotomocladium elegans]|nr:hypothetical protein BX666DRAFT_49671 [Dichotomocladium elegans]